jgi:hypothetical protein
MVSPFALFQREEPKMKTRKQVFINLIMFITLFTGAFGCAPQSMPAADSPVPTLPPGWETYSNDVNGQCGFAIDHPSDLDATSQDTHSWTLKYATTDPNGPFPNFIYISVIPSDFQSDGSEIIYNYNPAEMGTLLNLQVGESGSLRDDPATSPWFTYTRLPDTTFGNQAAQAYENAQPWEFPPSTKEIRYYLQGSGCTFLVGGYLSTVGSGQPGAIGEDFFKQVISTFHGR